MLANYANDVSEMDNKRQQHFLLTLYIEKEVETLSCYFAIHCECTNSGQSAM